MTFALIHINSYYFTNPVHAGLVKNLDVSGIRQLVYIPLPFAFPSHQEAVLQHGNFLLSRCYRNIERFLWPLKMYRIWQDLKRRELFAPDSTIHAHSLFVNGLIAYRAYKKWGLPYIITIRNTDFNVFLNRIPFFRMIGKKILDHASYIILPSHSYKDIHLKRVYHPDRHPEMYRKVSVIPNGIHDFWISNRQQKKNKDGIPTLLFAGKIDRNKNLTGLLRACMLLFEAGWQFNLVVIGDGPLLKRFSEKKYPFPVTFRGQVSNQKDMLAIYRNADLMVVPSFRETFGLVYPEAMSQGLPVLYSKHQGFDGFFPDGHIGYAVNPKDPADIAHKIQAVFEHYDQLSENACKAAVQFSWDRVAMQFLKVYESVEKENS